MTADNLYAQYIVGMLDSDDIRCFEKFSKRFSTYILMHKYGCSVDEAVIVLDYLIKQRVLIL